MTDRALPIVLPPEALEVIARRAAELVLEQLGQAGAGSPWLSLDEAADYLRVNRRTVERLIARGSVRSMTLGRRRLLHRGELDVWAGAATGEDVAPATPSRRRGA